MSRNHSHEINVNSSQHVNFLLNTPDHKKCLMCAGVNDTKKQNNIEIKFQLVVPLHSTCHMDKHQDSSLQLS